MRRVTLLRERETKSATFGSLLLDGEPTGIYTLEPLAKEKFGRISAGHYQLLRFSSKKFGETWIVNPTPGRTGILFHDGNYPGDTRGCILLGLQSCPEISMIRQSDKAVEEFRRMTRGEERFGFSVVEKWK